MPQSSAFRLPVTPEGPVGASTPSQRPTQPPPPGENRELEESLDYLRDFCGRVAAKQAVRQYLSRNPVTNVFPVSETMNAADDEHTRDAVGGFRLSRAGGGGSFPPTPASTRLTSPIHASSDTEDRQHMLAILSFLVRRYGAGYGSDPSSISSTTVAAHVDDSLLTDVLDQFCREARTTIQKERNRMSLVRDGVRRVNFAPDPPSTPAAAVTAADAPRELLPPPSSPVRKAETPVKVDTSQTSDRKAHSPVATPAHPSSHATTRGTSSDENRQSRRKSKRALKEAMRTLQAGTWGLKFSSSHGRAASRYLWVADAPDASHGPVLPYLCWDESRPSVATHAPSSSKLPLPSLMQCTTGQVSAYVQRDADGVCPRGVDGERLSLDRCVTLRFEGRDALDLCFPTAAIASEWSSAFQRIIDKNKERRGS